MLASEVMDRSAALVNDAARTKYTYVAQLPYLNMALDELMESLEENNVSITNKASAIIPLTALDTTLIGIPTDLVEIQAVYEADSITSGWSPLEKVDFLPSNLTITSHLGYYSYQNQEIKFIGANGNKIIKIEYIAKIQVPLVDHNSQITIINSKSFLAYRNASLCAEFIGENKTRADSLNGNAQLALDRMLGINIKGNQGEPVRRRPFMAGYKNR